MEYHFPPSFSRPLPYGGPSPTYSASRVMLNDFAAFCIKMSLMVSLKLDFYNVDCNVSDKASKRNAAPTRSRDGIPFLYNYIIKALYSMSPRIYLRCYSRLSLPEYSPSRILGGRPHTVQQTQTKTQYYRNDNITDE